MNMKKIFLIILVIAIIIGIIFAISNTSKEYKKDSSKTYVVTSNFASYDFLRAIIGDNKDINLTFLMGPGKDAHSYDPSSGDLIKIQNADLFVYVGGGIEQWADKVLDTLDTKNTKIICISDFVDTIEEQEVDGAEKEDEEEEEGAFDEHIWTSPSNAIKMVEALEKAVEELDVKNSKAYEKNAKNYIKKIEEVDQKISEVVNNKVRDTLVFGDKMPMQYFMNYYNLKVSAAFSGCSTETEPSASTIAYLTKKVKEEKIPVVLYIELSNGKVAKTIADEAGCKAMQIQTLHNVSLDDFNNGETWVSLMEKNINVLKECLQ